MRLIANHRLISFSKSVARENKISFQCAVRSGGGTDAGPIHMENKAIPSLILGMPVRYAHTHYGFSALEDYRATVNLTVEILKRLNSDQLQKF